MVYFVEFLFRWAHVLFGVVWVGLLYYFNFIQGEYFKEADANARADVIKKMVPRALWWFRWAALMTFATGVYLFIQLGAGANQYIAIAAFMGTLMFANVWLIIWPNQKIVCGLKPGDTAAAGAKALLASRTNTLLSAPMLFGMLGSKHGSFGSVSGGMQGLSFTDPGFVLALLLVVGLEINAVVGQLRQLANIAAVVQLSMALTTLIYLIIHFL